MIKKWFEDWDMELCGAKHRLSTLVCLFNFLKKNGVTSVNEDMAGEILEYTATDQTTNIVLLEIFHAKEIVFDSEVVEAPETTTFTMSQGVKQAMKTKEGVSAIVTTDEEYDEEDAKPKLHIDKSELKTKEFDLDVLAEFGLNIEDLQNE